MGTIDHLAPTEPVPGRPFADHKASEEDLSTMRWMAEHLRSLAVGPAGGERPVYTHQVDENGATHRIVVPDWRALQADRDVTAVGFFGQIRPAVNHSAIMDLENELIEQLPTVPGLLTYYNLHRPKQGYGNLVLFASEDSKDGWRDNETHSLAVERTPDHYYSVRLHNGLIPGGVMSSASLLLLRTKYFDFRNVPHWRSVREYGS
jgi:hypothetical protein